ncbi:patatin-like phospholipase family protein, partial [Paracidovorax cattleyae]
MSTRNRTPRLPAAPASPSRPDARRPAAGADMQSADHALVLQGGGALGSYQAGVYEALFDAHPALDWVAGVSIGAINAALIAGNAPEHRVARLREFWSLVSSGFGQQVPGHLGDRALLNQWSAATAVLFGIPGFFQPRRD